MQTNNTDNQGKDSRGNQNDMNENTGNLGSQNQQNMGNRGNAMDDEWGNSTQQGHESDGPRLAGRDINDTEWDNEGRDPQNAQSRTFNEDEETWEEEQRMGGSNANRGSEGNDWNQNDQMQRSPGRGSSEENRDASSSDYYERDRDNLNNRNNTSGRSNNGDDF